MRTIIKEREIVCGKRIKPLKDVMIINLITSMRKGLDHHIEQYEYYIDYDDNPTKLLNVIHFYEAILFIIAERGYVAPAMAYYEETIKPIVKELTFLKKRLENDLFRSVELVQYIYVPIVRKLEVLPSDFPIVTLGLNLCIETYNILFYYEQY